MARGTDDPHWLSVGNADRDRQMAALLDFERSASVIVDVSPLLIPGLLQTADYARAIMVAAGVPASQIEMRVVVRVGRREVLTRRDPAQLLALVGEAALRQKIGGPQALIDQLNHLLKVADLPNVDLRIFPADGGWTPALEGPFVLINSADGPPIVHLENRRSGLFFHEKDDVAAYEAAIDRVKQEAMSPAASRGLIADIITELETTT